MPTTYRKIFTQETEEELLNMTRDEACLNLNDRVRRFCEIYVGNFNPKIAAIQAGYDARAAATVAWKIRQNEDANRYLAWLKLRVCQESHVSALDIVNQYARIGFADMNDFLEKGKFGKLKIKDLSMIDGQLIKKVKDGPNGVEIELVDKMSALQKLERYFDVMPKDWKQKLEERKVELLEKRLELDKQMLLGGEGETEDDGFLDALKGSAEEVWEVDTIEEDGDVIE